MDSPHPYSPRRTASPTPELQRSTHCILADETLSVVRTHRFCDCRVPIGVIWSENYSEVLERENHRTGVGRRVVTSARRHYSVGGHEQPFILPLYPGSSPPVTSWPSLVSPSSVLPSAFGATSQRSTSGHLRRTSTTGRRSWSRATRTRTRTGPWGCRVRQGVIL